MGSWSREGELGGWKGWPFRLRKVRRQRAVEGGVVMRVMSTVREKGDLHWTEGLRLERGVQAIQEGLSLLAPCRAAGGWAAL